MSLPLSSLKLLLIYSALLLILSLAPINSTGLTLNDTFVLTFRLDYLVHFIIFIPYTFLVWISFRVYIRTGIGRTIFFLFATILFSALTEAIQYYLPYRSFNINDLTANTIGVLLGSLSFLFPQSRFPALSRYIQ